MITIWQMLKKWYNEIRYQIKKVIKIGNKNEGLKNLKTYFLGGVSITIYSPPATFCYFVSIKCREVNGKLAVLALKSQSKIKSKSSTRNFSKNIQTLSTFWIFSSKFPPTIYSNFDQKLQRVFNKSFQKWFAILITFWLQRGLNERQSKRDCAKSFW